MNFPWLFFLKSILKTFEKQEFILRSLPGQAVTLGCAHSFCHYCIEQWRKKRDECPICRQAIQSRTRCLALDNCINSMVENLSVDMKARRQTLVIERKGERCVSRLVALYLPWVCCCASWDAALTLQHHMLSCTCGAPEMPTNRRF